MSHIDKGGVQIASLSTIGLSGLGPNGPPIFGIAKRDSGLNRTKRTEAELESYIISKIAFGNNDR